MPRIRCHYIDCVFLDDGYCGAAGVEYDPDMGCMTYKITSDVAAEDDWEEGDAELDDWGDLDDDDDMWIDDDDY